MFITLGQMLKKSKLHFGFAIPLTAKNFWWLIFILLAYYYVVLVIYIFIGFFWLVYAMCFGIYKLIKWIIQTIIGMVKNRKEPDAEA